MLIIEEVRCPRISTFLGFVTQLTSVSWVQWHRLETLMLRQGCASPLPDTSHIRLTSKSVTISSHSYRVPILEAHIGPSKVGEEFRRTFTTVDIF